MTGLSSRCRRVRWGDRRIGPFAQSWHRIGGSSAVNRHGPRAPIHGASSEHPTMPQEALRRNGFQGSGNSGATRLTGLLTLCRQGCRVYSAGMQHATSICDGRDLTDNEEPDFSVKSPDIDVPPTPRQGSFHTIRHMAQIRTRNATWNRPRRKNSLRERRVDPVTAFARQPCQITHARATSCGRSTG
jgi:hypothetical protein